jgi:hypothetical protein
MSNPISLPTGVYPGFAPLAIDGIALARFSIDMSMQLHELEQRFVTPRKHPRLIFGQSRKAPRRPR